MRWKGRARSCTHVLSGTPPAWSHSPREGVMLWSIISIYFSLFSVHLSVLALKKMLPGLRILLVLPKCVREVLVKPESHLMIWQFMCNGKNISWAERKCAENILFIICPSPWMSTCWVLLAGPLEAGGQVQGLVHIVPRNKLVQPEQMGGFTIGTYIYLNSRVNSLWESLEPCFFWASLSLCQRLDVQLGKVHLVKEK